VYVNHPAVAAKPVLLLSSSTVTLASASPWTASGNQPLVQLWARVTPPTKVCLMPAAVICWSSVAICEVYKALSPLIQMRLVVWNGALSWATRGGIS